MSNRCRHVLITSSSNGISICSLSSSSGGNDNSKDSSGSISSGGNNNSKDSSTC